MGNHWTLQDAQTEFSTVVNAARQGKPQHVTDLGEDAVVVLAAEEFRRLSGLDNPPKTFKQHLADFPKFPEGMEDIFDKREPVPLEIRDFDFDR